MKELITGNMAAAVAAKLCRPQVIAAYPITPQTTIIEYLAKMVTGGELKAEYIKVESEHSAMAACIGAAAAGCRVFTATASQGLLLMHEMLWQASGLRLPIVMVNVNRAVGSPWNVWTDQTDSLAQRDTGWLQFYCENGQEVLDMVIMAYKIAEAVSLPAMVVSEGFVLSHTAEPVDVPSQDEVDAFLPPYQPKWKLDLEKPAAFGGNTRPLPYAQMRKNIQEAMNQVSRVQFKTNLEFFRIFGRCYSPLDYIGPKNPEILFITSGTISGTAREAIKNYRDVALMKIRTFRPFPYDVVKMVAERAKKIAVIDRNISFGSRGIFAESVRSSLYTSGCRPPVFEFLLGIGGVDVTPEIISNIIEFTKDDSNCSLRGPVWQEELECTTK